MTSNMVFSGALLRLDEPPVVVLPSIQELEVWKKASEESDESGDLDEDNVDDVLDFVDRYLCPRKGFVVIYLCRPYSQLETMYQECVQECLKRSVAIIAKDIKCTVEQGDESILFETLGLLFDKENQYYQELGGKIVRNRVIDVFQVHGGFAAMAKYLSFEQFPLDFKFLKHLVEAAYSLLVVTPRPYLPPPEFTSSIEKRRAEAIVLVNTIIERLRTISLASLEQDNADVVGRVLNKIWIILCASSEHDVKAYFQVCFDLIPKLLMSGSDRLKAHGWTVTEKLLGFVPLGCPPARTVTVSHAGCTIFNGVYSYDGPVEVDGYINQLSGVSYKRLVPATSMNDTRRLLMIVPEEREDESDRWILVSVSEGDLSGLGTSSVTHYETNSFGGWRPPAEDWIPTSNTGVHPPPTLTCHGSVVSLGEEFNTVEHVFAKWIVDNRVLELALCEEGTFSYTHGALLMKFVAQVGSKSRKRNDGYLQASHVLMVWRSFVNSDDSDVCASLRACLGFIFHQLSDETALELLRAMHDDVSEWRKTAGFCLCLLSKEDYEQRVTYLSSEVQRELQKLFWRVRARLYQDDSSESESEESSEEYEAWIKFETVCGVARKSIPWGKAHSAVLDVPRSPTVAVVDGERRRIRVSLPIEGASGEFFSGIQVYAECDDGTQKLALDLIDRDIMEGCLLEGRDKVTIEASLPKAGLWNVSWQGRLLRLKPTNTQWSSATCVDLTVHAIAQEKKKRKAIISMDENARRQAGDIQSVLQKLRGPCSTEMDIKTRYSILEAAMERGQATLSSLKSLVEDNGADEESLLGIPRLTEALAMALPTMTKLQSCFNTHIRKVSGKEFTSHVADLIVSNDASEWLKEVDTADLEALGGDSNRLYQMLVEQKGSKKARLQQSGALMLEAAAARTDLFSKKQIKALTKLKLAAKSEPMPSGATPCSPSAIENGVSKEDVQAKPPVVTPERLEDQQGQVEDILQCNSFVSPIRMMPASEDIVQGQAGCAADSVFNRETSDSLFDDGKENDEPCSELFCPISLGLMTIDPVLAADGHTYERAAVVAWFDKQQIEILAAEELFAITGSLQAQAIVERGVLSPMTNEKMEHLSLTSNKALRTMARDAAAVRASTETRAPFGQANN